MVKELSQASFDDLMKDSKLPVLVDFWAPWCGPCKQLTPILDSVSKDMEKEIVIAKINIDDNPDLAAKYNVRSIPTMIIFKNGEVKDVKVGSLTKDPLEQWIKSQI